MDNLNNTSLLNNIDFENYKLMVAQLLNCDTICFDKLTIENYLNFLIFELRVIQEQIDFTKYK